MIHLCRFTCPACGHEGKPQQAQVIGPGGAVGEGALLICLDCRASYRVLLVEADKVPEPPKPLDPDDEE